MAQRAARAIAIGLCVVAAAAHASPGTLTSAAELAVYRTAADAGSSPQKENRDRLMSDARKSWAWGSVSGEYGTTSTTSGKKCQPVGAASDYLLEGSSDAYAQVLGSYLRRDASLAREARTHVLDLVDTSGFRGLNNADYSGDNQCVLDLSLSIPVWIEAARLLEDSGVWSGADTVAFRSWLATQVYPKVAWASRARRNNWGAAGSNAASAIASYVNGGVASLQEYSPALTLTPSQAVAAHDAVQLSRVGSSWVGDAQCTNRGIQWHGGIPEELRRGSTGCDGTYLVASDSSSTYQMMHVELLVFHAEAMLRRGNAALYQARTSQGAPAILQAILFVVQNPAGGTSWPWSSSRWGALITAASYYDNTKVGSLARQDPSFRGGRNLPYTRITARPIASAVIGTGSLGTPGQPYIVK